MKKVHAEVAGHAWCRGQEATRDNGFLMGPIRWISDWDRVTCNSCRRIGGMPIWVDPAAETISLTRAHLSRFVGKPVTDEGWANLLKHFGTGSIYG